MENMADNHSDHSDKKTSDIVENEEQKPLLTKTKKTKKVSPHTKKVRLLSLFLLGSAEFLGGCTLSILAPFYSKEAESHGLSVSAAGAVFASIFVLQIVFIPIFGILITKIGSTRLFIVGVLVAGFTNIAFGFLPSIKSGEGFLAASLLMRGVTAVGEAAMNTAVLPLARKRGGPGREASVTSWMETMNGVGTTAGPFVGGILFNYGGFCFPFVVSGSLMVFVGLAAAIVLDPQEEKQGQEETVEQELGLEEDKLGFWALFRSPNVLLAVLITVITGMAAQWYQPSLEPYVRQQFGMKPFQASLLFIVDGAVYALASPLVGLLLDRCLSPHLCVLGGTLTIGLGYLLLAPLPPFLISPSIAQICVGAALHGLGMSANFMGTITMLGQEEERKGGSTERMAGLMTSLWITAESLGSFLGALAGAGAYDSLGWSSSCLVVASVQLLGLCSILAVTAHSSCARGKRKSRQDEKEPLAGKKNPGYGACEENNNCVDVV